jgi:hypothetical protein
MAKHQHDKNADKLWQYFQDVIAWVRETFTNHRKEMATVNWGELYNKYKDKKLNAKKLEEEVTKLMQDDDVTKKSGIYTYVLTGDERHLSIRAFNDKMKREAYERQKGVCPWCKKEKKEKQKWNIEEMEADHKPHFLPCLCRRRNMAAHRQHRGQTVGLLCKKLRRRARRPQRRAD